MVNLGLGYLGKSFLSWVIFLSWAIIFLSWDISSVGEVEMVRVILQSCRRPSPTEITLQHAHGGDKVIILATLAALYLPPVHFWSIFMASKISKITNK